MAALPSQRTALVLYGSETGNAQDLAEELGRIVQRLHFTCEVLPLEVVQPNILNDFSVTLITISTTGQGDIPANAKGFWKQLLRKRLPETYLSKTDFALFGLGDTSYPQYNWAALKLNKRLVQLGAKELIPRGESDEQHPEGHDASFVPWAQTLRSRLLEALPLPPTQTPIPDNVLLQPPWLLSLVDNTNKAAINTENNEILHERSNAQQAGPKAVGPRGCKVLDVIVDQNKRVTASEHFQDVRHFVFSTDYQVQYSPGDVLTVYPRNHSDEVQQLISIMDWGSAAESLVEFGPNPSYAGAHRPRKPSLSNPNTTQNSPSFRELLASQLDLNAIPRRSFFSLIAHFTDDEFQKERLLEFANPELVDELFDYTTRPRRSILEVLQEFDTLKIPWQWAAAVIPQLRGRQFSIASGGELKRQIPSKDSEDGISAGKTRFELLVAIVKYRTVIKKIRRGVCTRYLESLVPGDQLPVTFQKGTLTTQPSDLSRPIVMIGPGTGLAPIRSLIWERWALQQAAKLHEVGAGDQTQNVGRSFLFFGCRSSKADYFFKNEWEILQKLGMPLTVFVAFSRDQGQKVYVQDVISEQHELVYSSVCKDDGLVFVCGSSGKMPQAVRAALLDVMQKSGGLDPGGAEQELKKLEKIGRYKQETW